MALSQLKTYVQKVPFLELVAACPDTFSAMQTMEQQQVDAIFADISMPDLNGLEFIRSLDNPPIVVFATAYSDYAVAGYKVNAVDYLLKPYSFDEFVAAATKVKRTFELKQNNSVQPVADEPHDFIYVKSDHSMSRIDTSSIIYIEGMGEYVRIFTNTSDHPYTALLSLRKIEQSLPNSTFLRVHKSYIVNMSQLSSVTKTSIVFGRDSFVPIGEAYRANVQSFIENHSLS